MNKKSGFTLVELMIVVAIIGILSAIAVPNFKKYQAKSKITEAKLQLAAAYTAEQGFFGEYNIYHVCLSYMGYDSTPEVSQRYYKIGFNYIIPNYVNAIAYASAVSLGLNSSMGYIGSCTNVDGSGGSRGHTVFDPGRGIGSSIATVTNGYNSLSSVGFYARIGDQSDINNMTFNIAASGVISENGNTPTTSSVLSIDQNKKIMIHRNGFLRN